ncbi:beta-ketoacyl-[acyl-carrier-protein] synthase family protein [Motilimonas eburnea]|uniref:beta-ketoacyl-[acyl-carrier-protein] synthase family protein n=1 Tax=Motilimonas eburnea TaxID=1737488 RepID=UPI001E5664D0|nr:beta-ketoacyl-[acyl-carrier-protein] synthase family protein [Motilimonas eburnea]MCE2570361.1 beta-ketoacyl-[acyl-carrier-protein] synthase family protein [Motilimonas eburnea]
MKRTDAVVTGLGCASSLGNQVGSLWQNLLAGKLGYQTMPSALAECCPDVHLLAQVERDTLLAPNPTWPVPAKQLRQMTHVSKMLCHSAIAAIEQSGLLPEQLANNPKVGLLFGCGVDLCERHTSQAINARNPNWLLDAYPNMHLAHLAKILNCTGFNSTLVNACTSASQAIGQAMQMINAGLLDVAVVGGCDSRISPAFLSGFARLNMLSQHQDPNLAMRPFDEHRSGFVLAEGAGVLVLESRAHANKRSAKVLGSVVGFGCSQDAYRLTEPCPKGKAKAMQQALQRANLASSQIGYINSHGTATQQNDATEAIAIEQTFGHHAGPLPWVNSSKGLLGHSLAASGAIEAIICVQTLCKQMIHPNRPLTQSDAEPSLRFVTNAPQPAELDYCMSNSSALGGTNTSLIFQREPV